MVKVYFTREITPEACKRLYDLLISDRGGELEAPVAVKVHSGEVGNQNFIKPEFFAPTIKASGGIVTECNTAYDGGRDTTARHIKTLKRHGWSEMFDVDLLDAEGPDMVLDIPEGQVIKKEYTMPLDGFYISMLSEKYRGARLAVIKGFWNGLKGWFAQCGKHSASSSIIYVFKKIA